jgi:hypothetical protein
MPVATSVDDAPDTVRQYFATELRRPRTERRPPQEPARVLPSSLGQRPRRQLRCVALPRQLTYNILYVNAEGRGASANDELLGIPGELCRNTRPGRQ